MKIACDNCHGVMYAKTLLHFGHEFCGWRCKEDWIDKRAFAAYSDNPAQLQLPLEYSHAAHTSPPAQEGHTAVSPHSQNAFEMSKGGTW